MDVGVARAEQRSRVGVQQLCRAHNPKTDGKKDEDQRENGAEVASRARSGRRPSRRQRKLAVEAVDDGADQERQHGEGHQQVEYRGDRGEREQIEPDIPGEERVDRADVRTMQGHQHRHPERRGRQAVDQRHQDRADEEEAWYKSRDVDANAAAAVHEQRREPGLCRRGEPCVPINEAERDQGADHEERGSPNERCEEDGLEVHFPEPEPVGGESAGHREHDKSEKCDAQHQKHDLPNGRASRAAGAPERYRGRNGHDATNMTLRRPQHQSRQGLSCTNPFRSLVRWQRSRTTISRRTAGNRIARRRRKRSAFEGSRIPEVIRVNRPAVTRNRARLRTPSSGRGRTPL